MSLFLGCFALPLTQDVRVVLELWDLEDPTDGPNGHHFVLGLLACWCEDPLNLGARGEIAGDRAKGRSSERS